MNALSPEGLRRPGFLEVRTVDGGFPPVAIVTRLCRPVAIKPGRSPFGACSLGQDFGQPELPDGRTPHVERAENDPLFLSDQPSGISKRNEVLVTMFFIGRAKARRHHWAGTPVGPYLKPKEPFAKSQFRRK